MKTFEYQSQISSTQEELNEFGKDGWEAISMIVWEEKILILMKREINEE